MFQHLNFIPFLQVDSTSIGDVFQRDNLFSLLWALALTVGLLAAIWGLNKLFKIIYSRIDALTGTKIKGVSYQGYHLLTPDASTRAIILAAKLVRLLIVLIVLYAYLLLLFNLLPWTEAIYDTLKGWVIGPLSALGSALVGYLPKLVFVLIVFWLTRKLIKLLGFFAEEIAKGKLRIPGFYPDWVKPTFNILRFFIYVLAIVFVFPYLPGSGSPAFQGVSLFLGVLFSLGSTSIIANAVGGVMIIYMRPFIIGDMVNIAGTTGKVIEKNLLVTRLATSKNEEVTIPNAAIISSHITNYSTHKQTPGIFLHSTVTIGYDVPWRNVHDVMLAAAKKTPGIEENPKPFVLQTALNDFNVSYQINAFTNKPDVMPRTYSLLHQNLQDEFNKAGIEIMSPHYAAVRDGNETTIPQQHRPVDYRPPFFRLFDFGRPRNE